MESSYARSWPRIHAHHSPALCSQTPPSHLLPTLPTHTPDLHIGQAWPAQPPHGLSWYSEASAHPWAYLPLCRHENAFGASARAILPTPKHLHPSMETGCSGDLLACNCPDQVQNWGHHSFELQVLKQTLLASIYISATICNMYVSNLLCAANRSKSNKTKYSWAADVAISLPLLCWQSP